MENPSEPRERRSQRDYSLPFKLAVVGEVGRGELSYKQAQRRYGIQGRSTVLSWCRRYASHFVTFQAAGLTSPGAAPAVDPTPEQRIKQLEKSLEKANVMIYGLNAMIDYAEKELKVPVRKKHGTKQ